MLLCVIKIECATRLGLTSVGAAVQVGQAGHACKFAKKEYRVQTRRSKRAYTKYQKAGVIIPQKP